MESILHWRTPPARPIPVLLSVQQAASPSFALDTSKETFGLPSTVFQEAEFEQDPWGDLSTGDVPAEIPHALKCQGVCGPYLETDCFSTFLTPTFQCVISEDKCTL